MYPYPKGTRHWWCSKSKALAMHQQFNRAVFVGDFWSLGIIISPSSFPKNCPVALKTRPKRHENIDSRSFKPTQDAESHIVPTHLELLTMHPPRMWYIFVHNVSGVLPMAN